MPDDWKVYKLGEFLPVITGKKNANISSAKGLYPFFSCSHDINWTDEYSFDGYAILVAGNGDFNVKWYNGKFEAYQRTYVLIPHNPRYTSWLYYAVKHNLSDITRVSRGSVISFITKSNLEDFSFVAPKNLEKFNLIDKFISGYKPPSVDIKVLFFLCFKALLELIIIEVPSTKTIGTIEHIPPPVFCPITFAIFISFTIFTN